MGPNWYIHRNFKFQETTAILFSCFFVQLYEDAVEMQHFFIKKRDEICKNGEILLTPALSYTERHLQAALDAEKHSKLLQEKDGQEKAKRESEERQLENNVIILFCEAFQNQAVHLPF